MSDSVVLELEFRIALRESIVNVISFEKFNKINIFYIIQQMCSITTKLRFFAALAKQAKI